MSLLVRDLQARLAGLDPDMEIMVARDGAFAPLLDVKVIPGTARVLLRCKGTSREGSRFSTAEEGIIAYLAGAGVSDEDIADLMERTAASIKRKRKTLGR